MSRRPEAIPALYFGPDKAELGVRIWGILICLVGSAVAIGLAPLVLPDAYSWISNTSSEAAAQGLRGAWLTRLGFLTFGLAVVWLTFATRWGWLSRTLHRSFGLLMVSLAAFSHRPFETGVAIDRTEDLLHSVAATAIGFSFAVGVLTMTVRRQGRKLQRRLSDFVAISASILIPVGMAIWGEYAGLLQRGMFLVAYYWYAREVLSNRTDQISAFARTSARQTASAYPGRIGLRPSEQLEGLPAMITPWALLEAHERKKSMSRHLRGPVDRSP